MEPEHTRFGGGASGTMLAPLTALWMLIAIVLILSRPRQKVITPFLLACFTIPIEQEVALGAMHFTVLRILIIAGLIRRAMDGGSGPYGFFPGGFNKIDRMVVLWTVSASMILSLQWMEAQALVHNFGDLLDALGGYLVVRYLITDSAGVRRTIKALAAICAIHGVSMAYEHIGQVNVFGYLGGFWSAPTIRDGKLRAHAVMGCIGEGEFAGVSLPLFVWLWSERKSRAAAWVGIAGALLMITTSSTSTSWIAIGAALLGLAFWPLRKQMRLIRWTLALTLLALHLAMNGPVWSLIARVDLTGSSSSYHRYYLVDNCIRHFSDWWLLGYRYYNDWGWDMWDTCNQFVDIALKGGLLALTCFIAVLSLSFGAIGTARKRVAGDRRREWLLWCFGASLFANVVGWFGINYMAQESIGLFALLACISVAISELRSSPALPSTKASVQNMAVEVVS